MRRRELRSPALGRLDGLVRRLKGSPLLYGRGKDGVDELENPPVAAEVGPKHHALPAFGEDAVDRATVGDDVGPAEAVDRLLGIPDQEELARTEPTRPILGQP